MSTITEAEVSALGKGINLTAMRAAIPNLEALCNAKIAAAEDFRLAVTVAALNAGLLPAVLAQYIVARCTETVAKKARSAGQLSLLFEEIA